MLFYPCHLPETRLLMCYLRALGCISIQPAPYLPSAIHTARCTVHTDATSNTDRRADAATGRRTAPVVSVQTADHFLTLRTAPVASARTADQFLTQQTAPVVSVQTADHFLTQPTALWPVYRLQTIS